MNTSSTISRREKMDPITSKLILAGALFLLTLATGVLVSHAGRPLSIGLVTIHKLIAVGSVVAASLAISQLYKTTDGRAAAEIIITVIGAISCLALIATGAFLTREEMQLPALVLKIHQSVPLLALASSSLTVYLLAKGNL